VWCTSSLATVFYGYLKIAARSCDAVIASGHEHMTKGSASTTLKAQQEANLNAHDIASRR